MSFLFGFYDLGLRALSAAQMGMQLTGENISNVNTPGFAKRRVDFVPGFPVQVPGGQISHGVEIGHLRRLEDTLLQRTLERERGGLGYSEERLRGLQDVESIYGTIDGNGILDAFGRFSQAFNELAANPEDLALRRGAISNAEGLARSIRDTYEKLTAQRRLENQKVEQTVQRINTLSQKLAGLNREISAVEVDGSTAASLRDEQVKIVEELSELTGGTAVRGTYGRIAFHMPGGPTLVTGDEKAGDALTLEMTRDADGFAQIQFSDSGIDITGRIEGGRLGAMLSVRDDVLVRGIEDLDSVAMHLIAGSNFATTTAFDRNGTPGVALFEPDPPTPTGAARRIAVNSALLSDPALLAVSADGTPGDGSVATQIAGLADVPSVGLGNLSMLEFLRDGLGRLGDDRIQQEIQESVSRGVLDDLEFRRESVSGVDLDEEAVQLLRFQSSYQAAARFIQVLNEVTEITVNLV